MSSFTQEWFEKNYDVFQRNVRIKLSQWSIPLSRESDVDDAISDFVLYALQRDVLKDAQGYSEFKILETAYLFCARRTLTWLRGLAQDHSCRNYMGVRTQVSAPPRHWVRDPVPSPEYLAINNEAWGYTHEVFKEAFPRASERYFKVLEWQTQGYSKKEMSAFLGVSVNRICSMLEKIRLKVRPLMIERLEPSVAGLAA